MSLDYIDYAYQDVIATRAVFDKALDIYRQHQLAPPPHRILSVASVGKAYFDKLNIKPLLERFNAAPSEEVIGPDGTIPAGPRLLGIASEAFYGGRADIGYRGRPIEVIATDYTSQYPTAQVLLGLQRVLLAKRLKYRQGVEEARELLTGITVEQLLQRSTTHLLGFVRIVANQDILPVRSNWGESDNIASCVTTSALPMWYSLSDACASVILTGKVPEILDAVFLVPSDERIETSPIDIFGDERYRINLAHDEFFERLIELRNGFKEKSNTAAEGEKEYFDNLQLALKLTANATSYGIFAEIINDKKYENPQPVTVWTGDGKAHQFQADYSEKNGRYYYPPIASLITGASKLLLGVLEWQARDVGLEMALCDTDSFVFGRPAKMPRARFVELVTGIVESVQALSPYDGIAMLKVEHGIEFPVYAFTVSPKRYALFSVSADGFTSIEKFTSHALGSYVLPSDYKIPERMRFGLAEKMPVDSVETVEDICWRLGGHPWIYALWHREIVPSVWDCKALFKFDRHGIKRSDARRPEHPGNLSFDSHEDFKVTCEPDIDLEYHAKLRISLTTWNRYEAYKYLEGARPGNFFWLYNVDGESYGRALDDVVPGDVTAYDTDGKRCYITPNTLGQRTLAHFKKKNVKASNGGEVGTQHRLEVNVTALEYIGKETNFLNVDDDEPIDDESAEALGEGTNRYRPPTLNSVGLLTDEDLKDSSLRVSIAWQIQPILRAVRLSVVAATLGISPSLVRLLAKEPPWYERPTSNVRHWVSRPVLARFLKELDGLRSVAGINY